MRRYDYNLIVIGGGSAGLVSAYIAATLKARVALIEKQKMGGDCLNTGCVPSKALIRSAQIASYARRSRDFGFKSIQIDYEFAEVMERVQKVIKKVAPHDSVERYSALGVDCIEGEATLISPHEVSVGGKILTSQAFIIASGARPFIPPIKGLEQIQVLTSDNIWNMRERPGRLVVLGGGPIGCELAQCFARLGSQVTLIEQAPRLMVREDEDVTPFVSKAFSQDGIKILCEHRAEEIQVVNGVKTLLTRSPQGVSLIPFDQLLVAVGRKANVTGFGLEKLGVKLTPRGTIAADEFMATNFKNIFVCGDVTGPYQFTHMASHQAYFATVNALFRPLTRFLPSFLKGPLKVNYSVVPWATYTDPEVATVGLNELAAKEQGIPYELTTYGLDDLDRAIADDEDHGLVKVLTKPGSDQILGATIVGYHASDLITEFITAMKHGLGLNSILGTIHIYPTMSEANKFAAGVWKKARKPEGALRWLERFHRWQRG